MKKLILTVAVGFLFTAQAAAQVLTQSLSKFNRLQVGPLIEVVLSEGENEHIRIEYSGIAADKINYYVKGKELKIYLDDAKYIVNTEEIIKDGYTQNVSVYRNVKVKAYVTYKTLKALDLRGEESLSCDDRLISNRFSIRLFGVNRVDLAHLDTKRLVVYAFGENKLTIREGDSKVQKYRLFSVNKIRTLDMPGYRISTNFFGENDLNLYATSEISV